MPVEPRIPPLPEDEWDDDTEGLITASWFADRPTRGQNFFKTFVRHKELFRVWNDFGRTVFNGHLHDRDRELLILRVAWLTRCRFEWASHEPVARRTGVTDQDIEGIVTGPAASCWNQREAALMGAVDELMADSTISDATWSVLRDSYDDLQLIEIPVVVGQYQLVAYFNNTFGVEPDPALPPLPNTR
jgi:4-carboxymuconolactone decarboxylase